MSWIGAVVAQPGEPTDPSYFGRWAAAFAEAPASSVRHTHEVGGVCVVSTTSNAISTSRLTSGGCSREVVVVADARLDGVQELRESLRARGRYVPADAVDAELILNAYMAWGVDCVRYFLGDFAFMVWDAARERFLAATDHFGVRPLYYSRTSQSLVVSNWSVAVFRHRDVNQALADDVLLEFLWTGQLAHGVTAFRELHAVPRASRIVFEGRQLTVERYWELPVDPPPRRHRPREYQEEFSELLRVATVDRLRGRSPAILLSGGLDSPAIAVVAKSAVGDAHGITAHTGGYLWLMPDEEPEAAAGVARFLGISHQLWPADDYAPFHRASELALAAPAPTNNPFVAVAEDQMRAAVAASPVVVTGHGTDAILAPEPVGLMAKNMRLSQLAAVVRHAPGFFVHYRRRPPLGLRFTLAMLRPGGSEEPPRPQWLAAELPSLATTGAPQVPRRHRYRANAYRITAGEWIPSAIQLYTHMARRVGGACVHPFLDLRLVRFCLRLPAVPYCWDKYLLRRFLDGHVPPEIVRRPKSPFRGDTLPAAVRAHGIGAAGDLEPHPLTRRYFAWRDFKRLTSLMAGDSSWTHARPIVLDVFLRSWTGLGSVV